MTTNHKPATPLPWALDSFEPIGGEWTTCTISGAGGLYPTIAVKVRIEHAAYIAHAANAYQRLVGRVKTRAAMLKAWEESSEGVGTISEQIEADDALLRDLGE